MSMSLAFSPLSNRGPRLSDLAFERIAEAIVDGTLEPGVVLRDHELASQLGVSRMPVREALQRLERAGLVETAASRFTRVTVFTDRRIADGVEYAGLLYGGGVQMALRRMDDAMHERLIGLVQALCDATSDEEVFDTGLAALVFALDHTGNEVMDRRRDVHYLLARLKNVVSPGQFAESFREQREALRDAVVARDAGAGETAVRRMHGIC